MLLVLKINLFIEANFYEIYVTKELSQGVQKFRISTNLWCMGKPIKQSNVNCVYCWYSIRHMTIKRILSHPSRFLVYFPLMGFPDVHLSVEKSLINVRVLSAWKKKSSISQLREWRYRSCYSNTLCPPSGYISILTDARHGLRYTQHSTKEEGSGRVNVPRRVSSRQTRRSTPVTCVFSSHAPMIFISNPSFHFATHLLFVLFSFRRVVYHNFFYPSLVFCTLI